MPIFDSISGSLGVLVVSGAAAVALGAAGARVLRRRYLHWTWALLAAVGVLAVRPALGALTGPLAIACGWAAFKARRWRHHDQEAGLDLAERAGRERTPIAALRIGARRLSWLHAKSVVRAASGGPLALGSDEHGRTVWLPVGDERGGVHTLVLGATGSGKTVTQTRIAVAAIERGMGAVVVDPKGDRSLLRAIERAAAARGRELLVWTPHGESVYNPYARGSDTEVADKVLGGERFTEPHYLRQAQRYVAHVVRALRRAGRQTTLASIVAHLDPQRLEQLARELDEPSARATTDYLDGLTARQRSDLSGVRDRLAILAESDAGPWLDPGEGTAFDLLDAVRERRVVYLALEADSRPLLAQMLGGAIVADLIAMVASLQASPVATLVMIDEFAAVSAENVVRLFGRARSAGVSLLLGTQELADLRTYGGSALLDRIMGNLSALVAHRQVVPSSAETIARLAGGGGAWRVARHSDGRTTRTRTRRPLLDADRLVRLAPGWAAVISLAPGRDARIARVHAPAREGVSGDEA